MLSILNHGNFRVAVEPDLLFDVLARHGIAPHRLRDLTVEFTDLAVEEAELRPETIEFSAIIWSKNYRRCRIATAVLTTHYMEIGDRLVCLACVLLRSPRTISQNFLFGLYRLLHPRTNHRETSGIDVDALLFCERLSDQCQEFLTIDCAPRTKEVAIPAMIWETECLRSLVQEGTISRHKVGYLATKDDWPHLWALLLYGHALQEFKNRDFHAQLGLFTTIKILVHEARRRKLIPEQTFLRWAREYQRLAES